MLSSSPPRHPKSSPSRRVIRSSPLAGAVIYGGDVPVFDLDGDLPTWDGLESYLKSFDESCEKCLSTPSDPMFELDPAMVAFSDEVNWLMESRYDSLLEHATNEYVTDFQSKIMRIMESILVINFNNKMIENPDLYRIRDGCRYLLPFLSQAPKEDCSIDRLGKLLENISTVNQKYIHVVSGPRRDSALGGGSAGAGIAFR